MTSARALALSAAAVAAADSFKTPVAMTAVGSMRVVLRDARGGGRPHLPSAPGMAVTAIDADGGIPFDPIGPLLATFSVEKMPAANLTPPHVGQ